MDPLSLSGQTYVSLPEVEIKPFTLGTLVPRPYSRKGRVNTSYVEGSGNETTFYVGPLSYRLIIRDASINVRMGTVSCVSTLCLLDVMACDSLHLPTGINQTLERRS